MTAFQEEDYTRRFDASLWKKLLKLAQPFHKNLWIILATMTVSAGIDVALPWMNGYAIDHFIAERRSEGLFWFSLVYVLLIAMQVGVVFLFIRESGKVETGMCYHIRRLGFRKLQELYEKNELTSAINRVVEDQTHRFTVEVLTREFKSNDLALSARNLRRDRAHPNDILDRVDTQSVTRRLMELLEIRNRAEQTVELEPAHAAEIQEYLNLLDLTQNIDIVTMPGGEKLPRTVIAQPGLRYAQAEALIESLLLDPAFSDLSITDRNSVQERILSGIMGRMMEDAVLLETKLANPKKQVFVLQFAIGEFDMVVFDPTTSTCEIYEIRHSTEVVPEQTRHLIDEEKCKATEHRFGMITGKYVIYRGLETDVNGVQYLNVEKYLCAVGNDR